MTILLVSLETWSKEVMGCRVLDNTKPFAKQMVYKNTVYELRDELDLQNSFVTIPEGCVLRFLGGKIINGTISMNNCGVEGNALFECEVEGCPSNENIYTKWFPKYKNKLFVLFRNFCSCWYNDKIQVVKRTGKRIIHVEKGIYTVTEGIELRYEEDLEIDFGGSTLIDNIDTYDELRHRASPVIAMRESNRIKIGNCHYILGSKKGIKNTSGVFIEIGGPHVTTVNPNFNIKIENIVGDTSSKTDSPFIPFNFLGNCYNIEVGNISWKGTVSSLINLESALQPMKGKDIESRFGIKSWPYPDYYGLMPYNVTIHDIDGKERPYSKYGYIRTAGAYNVNICNVNCQNVREVIELYQGDAGNVRSAMNITISNVSSLWGEDMKLPNYAVSVNVTRKNPQSEEDNMINSDIAMITFTDCDFHDNAKGSPGDHYVVRIHGNNGMTVFRNCRISNTQRAVRIADIINTSLFKHITKFESCLFSGCIVGVESLNSIVSLRDCIFNSDEKQIGQIRYRIAGIPKESLMNLSAMLNVENCLFSSLSDISKPYVDVNSDVPMPNLHWINISRNIFNNTKIVPALKALNLSLNEEHNIGNVIK